MEVFFYGLFMDQSILLKNGLHPANPRIGYLPDYALKIGDRASLIPQKNEKSYGIVMTVDPGAIHRLYAEASVADYLPEEVHIVTKTKDVLTATCYNLPVETLSGTNPSYALTLYKLAKKKGFPIDYLKQIEAMSKVTTDQQ
jgi:hypothetical protein